MGQRLAPLIDDSFGPSQWPAIDPVASPVRGRPPLQAPSGVLPERPTSDFLAPSALRDISPLRHWDDFAQPAADPVRCIQPSGPAPTPLRPPIGSFSADAGDIATAPLGTVGAMALGKME